MWIELFDVDVGAGFGSRPAGRLFALLGSRRGFGGIGWAGDLVRNLEVVHGREGLLVGIQGGEMGAGAEAVEAAGVFDGDHGHLAVDHFELRTVALGFALGDELLVDDDGELGGVDLALVGEGGELGQEGFAPGGIGGVAEEQGGGFGGIGANHADSGPAIAGDDVFELLGKDGVDRSEVGRDGWPGGRGRCRAEAAGGLVLTEHGEELIVEGGVGTWRGRLTLRCGRGSGCLCREQGRRQQGN